MNSRLDRLFILLDTGSNESVRLAAAKQLGEVQRVQPHDLNYLVQRIKDYSSKSVWETRVAAGYALKCVLEQVDSWPLPTKQNISIKSEPCDGKDAIHTLLSSKFELSNIIRQFDLGQVINVCPKLLSLDTNSKDLEAPARSGSKDSKKIRNSSSSSKHSSSYRRKNEKDNLSRQRKLINKELGIVDSLDLGLSTSEIVSNDDLKLDCDTKSGDTTVHSTTASDSRSQQSVNAYINSVISYYDQAISLLEDQGCISSGSEGQASDCPSNLKEDDERELCDNKVDPDQASTGPIWPLSDISRQYSVDLFNPSWEIRHGSAIALREIVRLQGNSAGRRLELVDTTSNDLLNEIWLIDMSLKALCVLALDKFGDFLFDQVVAPVRENAAQLLGCCVAKLSQTSAILLIELILAMLNDSNWQTRHGGILALKYSLNVADEDFTKKILEESFDSIFKCLGDSLDDVSAEAAAALVPVKDLLVDVVPEKTPNLIKFLWEHLADLDELTTSTSNIVLLLASLIGSASAQLETADLIKSVPKLWSLLSHSSTSVRVSTLKALATLIESQKSTCSNWMPEDLLRTALRLIFQRSILENMEQVHPHIEEVWNLMVKIDENPALSSDQSNLLKCTSQYLNYWICLAMQPVNAPIDRGLNLWLNIGADGRCSETRPDGDVYIASSTFNAETMSQQQKQVTRCRLLAARLLGPLYANLAFESKNYKYSKETKAYLSEQLVHYFKTTSASPRVVSSWVLESWADHTVKSLKMNYLDLKQILPTNMTEQMYIALQEVSLCYDELAPTLTRLQQETRDFVAALAQAGINPDLKDIVPDKRTIYNFYQIQQLCNFKLKAELIKAESKRSTQNQKEVKTQIGPDEKSSILGSLVSRQANLLDSFKFTKISQRSLSASVLSAIAFAHVAWRIIPEKVEMLTEPLLAAIEIEDDAALQDKAINHLVTLLDLLSQESSLGRTSQNIVSRLIETITSQTAVLDQQKLEASSTCLVVPYQHPTSGSRNESLRIYQLDNLQRLAEQSRVQQRRQCSTQGSLKRPQPTSYSEEADCDQKSISGKFEEQSAPEAKLRGACAALNKIASHYADSLPERLPTVWTMITSNISTGTDKQLECTSNTPQQEDAALSEATSELIKGLKVLEVVGISISSKLHVHLLGVFKTIVQLLGSADPMIRHYCCKCIGLICSMMIGDTIEIVSKQIVPLLQRDDDALLRCGAIEAIALIIESLELKLVPHINMFIIEVLRRMSDQNDQIHLMATHCFAKLLCLMPLKLDNQDAGATSSLTTSSDKQERLPSCEDHSSFIEQLLNPKKLENFVLPFAGLMQFELRSYQQEGLNWLAFLNRFNLHGILCDEMGLGKTFMTICMVASDHMLGENKSADGPAKPRLPSLIICPSTLTEHWLYEIEKFLPPNVHSNINPIVYAGLQQERNKLRTTIEKSFQQQSRSEEVEGPSSARPTNLVVASYDIVRNDIEFFKNFNWNYCVLDEGHIIKNGKTKLSRAIRLLVAAHRLILSGTPIQNNVTELWSLFDFLMPGFLGSERQFNARYARPILQSREPKCSQRELEAGALAMESLHRQVLPFILRRLKEDVLDDLPPKIIQDYYCELSPLQMKLYEDFTRSKFCEGVTRKSLLKLSTEHSESETMGQSKSHVFQALQYLKNVCNHPKLVLSERHSQYRQILQGIHNDKSTLDDIRHSSKLKALKQLLLDCGIGVADSAEASGDASLSSNALQPTLDSVQESVVNQHRALIFCQVRSMVEIIEKDLLQRHLPGVTYLKLDGSVPSNQRFSIVSRFNNDPSIDILLLTTQIGGLGLNLIGADTVIFVEHDWNPTKDLQAIDRAHRIGQRKVVNVYRLISKGTLEERIMGLQKFKTMVSNAVINQDNAGLGTMHVEQLLDLFDIRSEDSSHGSSRQATSASPSRSGRSFADLLPELWDRQQYDTEYDLSNFVASIKD